MKKPLIAIACQAFDDSTVSMNMMRAVEEAGGLAFVTGSVEETDAPRLAALFDALLLTGGNDVDSVHFDQPLHPKAKLCSPPRDRTELALARAFAAAKKPILGICRGAQVLNVALGGDLIQHLFDLPTVRIDHANPETRHSVTLVPGSHIAAIFGDAETLTVNSTHHQAVGRPAPGFAVTARSEDGLIECIEKDDMLGTQWHPERLLDQGMGVVFQWLVQRAQSLT